MLCVQLCTEWCSDACNNQLHRNQLTDLNWPDPYSEAFKHLNRRENDDDYQTDEDAYYATDLENEDGMCSRCE